MASKRSSLKIKRNTFSIGNEKFFKKIFHIHLHHEFYHIVVWFIICITNASSKTQFICPGKGSKIVHLYL